MNFTPPRSQLRSTLPRLQLTSMIDVIFLLLIFFMVTTTFSAPERQLASSLHTERKTGKAADLQPQIVEAMLVDGAPAFVLGDRVTRDQPSLTELLRTLPKEGGVFVRVDRNVHVGWSAAALQACRDAGFEKVNYVPVE